MNRYRKFQAQRVQQSGASLFEVLISIVVLSIGLLGLAQMQAVGLKNSRSAYEESQATILAYDIVDRMRANLDTIDNYLTSYMTLESATAAGEQAGCKSTTGCSAAQLAQNDLRDWNVNLTTVLSKATGTIIVAGDTYTVNVSWDDDRDGYINENDPDFEVSFQP